MGLSAAKQASKEILRYDSFRPMQAEIIGWPLPGQGTRWCSCRPAAASLSVTRYRYHATRRRGGRLPADLPMKDQVEEGCAPTASARLPEQHPHRTGTTESRRRIFRASSTCCTSRRKSWFPRISSLAKAGAHQPLCHRRTHCISAWGRLPPGIHPDALS